MRQVRRLACSNRITTFKEHFKQRMTLSGIVLLSLASSSAMALAPNPGAVCPTGSSQGSFTNADYSSLFSQLNTSNYVTVAGNAAGSIPLQIRMTTSEANGSPTSGSFDAVTIGSNGAFNVIRDWSSVNSVTSVNLDFRNSITAQPIFLTNVALSAFDIDYALNNNNSFDDYVLFSGVTASGSTIDGSFQSVQASGSNIRAFTDSRTNTTGLGLYTVNTNTSEECAGTNLETECQGSVQFSEPVSSVKIRYSNANYRTNYTNPTNQQIFFRMDNYCYVPQYFFSGIVFDDNGGITAAQADANNANITSGTYFNKPNYFNGRFDPTTPELGISGSTVRLVNCGNTGTVYATQPSGTGTTIGQYQFSVPISTFGTNRNICLIESRTGTTYPIRTTTDNINTAFATTTYNYPNNNFGRVIPANAALVLRKAQYVNNCSSTLDYSANAINISGNTDPRAGFSEGSINGSIEPGQCIAYKITATNRANAPINDFIMRDVLQRQGQGGALVTSVLVNPIAANSNFASNSVAIGQNGSVVTDPLILNQRTNRSFYFNTKYSTINSTP